MTTRARSIATALALTLATAAPAAAQAVKSRQDIPFFTDPAAAALAARMLFICGGGTTGPVITGPVRYTVTVTHAEPAVPITLTAGGIPQATVVTSPSGKARFKFGANGAKGEPLDFDPRDHEIEIKDGDGDTLGSSQQPDGSTPDGSKIDERVALTATGAVPGASGHARFRERKGVRDFDVEIEDVPDGAYDLLVGGTARGTITVTDGNGEIEFASAGDDPDELPLDFDPLGAVVQVAEGSTIVLAGTMLAGAQGVSVCTASESTTALANVGPDPDAHGDARVRVKDDCDRDFRVEVEDLPVGAYEVLVGGVIRGSVDVVDVTGGTKGELEFDTDADDPDELLLDFDPVGQTVEIRQGTTIFLASTVGAPGPGTCEAIDVEPDLVSSGADPDADGKARFRQETDCDRDFRAEVQDLAIGDYELMVGGIVRGTIAVADVAGQIQGELQFDNDPDEPGELLLDFDPRGALVEVRQGATVYLSVTMPD
jgi:hypothetical protein